MTLSTVEASQLHEFSDASMAAYRSVIYHNTDANISISPKTRVAPLKKLTILKLELCGVLLTAKLLTSVAADLEVWSTQM